MSQQPSQAAPRSHDGSASHSTRGGPAFGWTSGKKTNPEPPVRLCCGQRHAGIVCPDGKVMCCVCFGRFDVTELHTYTGYDKPSDVCAECGARDEASVR